MGKTVRGLLLMLVIAGLTVAFMAAVNWLPSLRGSDAQLQRITLSEVKEQTQYRLKGRNVLLQVGTCDNEMPCSRMTWREDNGSHYTVLLTSSPFELIRIAESMIR